MCLNLGKPFALSQPTISKHLKVLQRAGLVAPGIEGSKWCTTRHVRHRFAAGGALAFVPAGPDGPARGFHGTYREISAPGRLVVTTPSPSGGTSIGTLVFTARNDGTALTLTIT